MSGVRGRVRGTEHLPKHWVGVRKHWPWTCRRFGEALVSLPPSALATHALLIGATGSGKSNLIHHIVSGDLQRGHSLVVFDHQGDFATTTLELCARTGVDPEQILHFDLRDRVNPTGFNPLLGQDPQQCALGVHQIIAAESQSWGVQLSETLRNALLLLAEASGDLTQLDDLFHNPTVRRSLIEKAMTKSVKGFWMRFDALRADRQEALAAPVLNKTSLLLAAESLRRMFGHKSPADLAAHLNVRGSVTIVSLAVDNLHGAGWMAGSLILNTICQEVFSRVVTPENERNPVRLVIDEFERFGMEIFESVLAEGRRFKLSLVLAHQTLAQLSPKMRSIVLGNVGVKMIFRVSHNDAVLLNKDISGDAKAFDLPRLRTGEAVLWRQGREPIEIEVNAPLIDDVGKVSPLAQELLNKLEKLKAPFIEEVSKCDLTNCEEAPNKSAEQHKHAPKHRNLEDWL